MKFAITALILLPLLSGCSGVISKPTGLTCPDVVNYSRETQASAASELTTQNVPVLTEFMKDYSVMRDQSRICLNGSR